MAKRCAVCDKRIREVDGKLEGTLLKVIENAINQFIYVCSDCQCKENWVELAKVRAA